MKIKINSAWRDGVPHVNIGGTWKKAVATWVNVGGTWRKQEYLPPEPPQLVTSPVSSTESTGIHHTFAASFTGADSYQWYRNGVLIQGATEATYLLLPKPSDNGATYKCRATNANGYTDSAGATLTLRPRIYMNWDITIPSLWSTGLVKLQFKADGSVRYYSDIASSTEEWVSPTDGADIDFNIADYQVALQSSSGEAVVHSTSDITTTYKDMVDGMELVLDVSACPVEASRHFSVKVRDKELPDYNWAGWDSDTLYYKREYKTPSVTRHPSSTSVVEGATATFTCDMTAEDGVDYQWEYRTSSSGTWQTSGVTGSTTTTIRVASALSSSGRQYRCKGTGKLSGKVVYSNAATMTVTPKANPPRITRQPVNTTVASGATTTISITATGDAPLTYVWKYRNKGQSSWSTAGATTASWKLTGSSAANGRQYYCIVSNNAGSATSNTITITVT